MRVPYKTNNNLYKEMLYSSLTGGSSYPAYQVYRKPGGGFFKNLKNKGMYLGKTIGKKLIKNVQSDLAKTALDIGKTMLTEEKKNLKDAVYQTMKKNSKEILKKGAKTLLDSMTSGGGTKSTRRKTGGKKKIKGKKKGGRKKKKGAGGRNRKIGIQSASSQRQVQRHTIF